MKPLIRAVENKLAGLTLPVQVRLPGGQVIGTPLPRVRLGFSRWTGVMAFATGKIGAIGSSFVEDRLQIEGAMRDVFAIAADLLPGTPVSRNALRWPGVIRKARSLASHSLERDAQQIQFHYDVSDDFYALWLDPLRVYSCAYFRDPKLSLAEAQEAKLDHICRKLMLRPNDRFLDIGAGWGGLLLWAAEHYGVDATGITLSKNQQAYVQRLIDERGLHKRVRVHLRDYRELDDSQRFDKIASVGMFEHVGQANLGAYFNQIHTLLAPGGLVLNHGITAGGLGATQLGAGMGDFIEKYIFPGGELLHVSRILRETAGAGLEMLDTENLRPHYARTLWAWSDALEARVDEAREVLAATHGASGAERVLRAYRLYLAGSAMSFEQGWVSLHQMLSTKPSDFPSQEAAKGSQCTYPFNRAYMYI